MSKQIVTTSIEIARFCTWAICDTIIDMLQLKPDAPPEWKDVKIMQMHLKKAIEKGEMKNALQGIGDARELFKILESVKHESGTAKLPD